MYDIINYVVNMKKILAIYKRHEEIINYLFIGGCTTLISLIAYYFSVFTFLNPNVSWELQLANIISWVVGVIFAFITNRKIVFKSKNVKVLKEVEKFLGARIVTLLIDMLFMYVAVTLFLLNDKIMKIISNVIVIVLNYVFSKLFVFVQKESEK